MKKYLLLLLSLLLLLLTLPPFNFSFLIFAAFAPLFLLARTSRFWMNLAAGAVAGAAYYGLLFYWIGMYTPAGLAIVLAALALYFGLYLAVTGFFLARSSDAWFDWLFPAALWLSMKWIISFWKPGFLAVHVSDSLGLDLAQSLYLAGENGLVLFIFLVNGWIYNFVRVKKPTRTHMIQLLALAILVLGMNAFARPRLAEKISADIPVAMVQPNLPYESEWRKANYPQIQSVYEKLTREAAQSKPGLIVWPQYAFPEDLRQTPNIASRLAQELKIPILLGTYVQDIYGAPLNVALYFSEEGTLAGEYAATFLPPLRFIGQRRGEKIGLIDTAIGKVGVLLCFEDTHPDLARRLVASGAEFLVLLCNDQFFGRSAEPSLHARRLILRAIESDRFVIRAAPAGCSQLIDPRGRVVQSTELFTRTILVGSIGLRKDAGLFFRTGDIIPYFALGLIGVLWLRRRHQGKARH